MRNSKLKYFYILILCVLITRNIYCQWPGTDKDTLNLMVFSGANVFFRYNTLNEISGTGITYLDWTDLHMDFKDHDNTNYLKLTFYANTTDLVGEYNVMDLSYIEVKATCTGPGTIDGQDIWRQLDSSPVDLLTGFENGSYDIIIDYKCGVGEPGLLNQPSDYYYGIIIFDVDEDIP